MSEEKTTEVSRECGIGVDGGGSKTVVVCHALDEAGTVLGRGVVGATNPNSVGDNAARGALTEGIEAALREAGRTAADVRAVALGMSGVDRPADRVKVQGWMRALFPHLARPGAPADVYDDAAPIRVHNDGTIALSCGTRGVLEGAVVICGTGTIALAYRGGARARAAGWGPRLGAGGCGYAIGRRVLTAAVRAHDGRGPATALLGALLAHLQLDRAEQLIPWVYDAASFSWQKIAALSVVAQRCAAAGDALAVHILERSAAGLAESVAAAAQRAGFAPDDALTIVYAGGLLSSGVLVPYLTPRLQARWPHATIVNPTVDPVMGAVYLNCRLHQQAQQ